MLFKGKVLVIRMSMAGFRSGVQVGGGKGFTGGAGFERIVEKCGKGEG
jgi:hypothetical protein